MDKRFAIFDLDGTLVESMYYWKNLAKEYLESKGVEHVPAEILERIRPMTMTESSTLFIQEFGLDGTPESNAAAMNAVMDDHYKHDIELKPGVTEYLQNLKNKGVAMCVASATAEPLVEICLRRLGVRDYFDFLLSCETVGAGKNKPTVYFESAKKLGAAPADIAVYEDTIFAARTAKNAGFYLVGVYDESVASHWDELQELADETIRSW